MQKPSSDTLRNAIVVASACVISFLINGTSRQSAQLFQACRQRFNVGRKESALPFALAYTMRNMSGPFVGFLGNKFGLRCVTVLGCAVIAVSIGACYLVEDIIPFTVLWGGCFGTGFGLGSILISNILHLHFKTDFNKVHGLFLASGCIGAFVLPGITEYLLKTYGTSGTFLILSGLILHCIPAAMLLKEPEKYKQIKIQMQIKEFDVTNRMYQENTNIPTKYMKKCDVTTQKIYRTKSKSLGSKNTEIVQFPCSLNDYTAQKTNEVDNCCKSSYVTNNGSKNTEIVQFPCSLNDYTAQKTNKVDNCCKSSYVTKDTNLSEKRVLRKVEDLADITTEVNKSKEMKQSIVSHTESQAEILKSEKDVSGGKKNTKSMSKSHPNSKSRNCQVFLDPAYILIVISLGLAMVVVIAMYTVIVDVCRDKGITEDVTVLMTFAIMEMLGRTFSGYVADGGCISPLNIYALCCGFCGILMIGFIWLYNFYVVLVFMAAIGSLMGGIIVLPAGMIRNYIKEKDITMALSSRCFLFGILNLSQPLIIGYFRETLQSYDGLFCLLGSMCIFSTILALFIPSAARFRDRRRMNKTKDKIYWL